MSLAGFDLLFALGIQKPREIDQLYHTLWGSLRTMPTSLSSYSSILTVRFSFIHHHTHSSGSLGKAQFPQARLNGARLPTELTSEFVDRLILFPRFSEKAVFFLSPTGICFRMLSTDPFDGIRLFGTRHEPDRLLHSINKSLNVLLVYHDPAVSKSTFVVLSRFADGQVLVSVD